MRRYNEQEHEMGRPTHGIEVFRCKLIGEIIKNLLRAASLVNQQLTMPNSVANKSILQQASVENKQSDYISIKHGMGV